MINTCVSLLTMDLDTVKDIGLYPTDHIFNCSERVLCIGSSQTGKTHLIENLVRRYAHRFYKIVICGNRNKLLEFPETRDICEYYTGDGGDGIFDPFKEMDVYDLKKRKEQDNKQLLLLLDDLMEVVYKSPVVSRIFSKGRHLAISCIVLVQAYFPTGGSGKSLFPQIRNNSTIQIFTKSRSHAEIGNIASRLEYGKKSREFFVNLYKKLVQEKRYGYLMVMLDSADARLRYCNNVLSEDGSPYLTVYT